MTPDTLPRVFIDQLEKNMDNTFLMYKHKDRWREVTWREVGERVQNIALGLMALGVKNGDRVSGIAETRPDYAYCCIAIANVGAIFSPIYQTNSPGECAHVLNDAGPRIIFAENQNQCEKILKASEQAGEIEKIIVLDAYKGVSDKRIIFLDQLIEMGKESSDRQGNQPYLDRIQSVKPEDVTAIIYTSGTTGPPKGVMDTNAGVLRNISEYIKIFPLEENERGLSFLPLAHALELRNGHWFHIRYGFTQIYPESMRTVFDDAREKGVTFFFTTPRFFEKNYNTIMAEVKKAPQWKKTLINWSLCQGRQYNDCLSMAADSPHLMMKMKWGVAWILFIRKVRQSVGLKLRYSGVGGAPAAPEIIKFYHSCGLPLYEGYGLTEAQGMVSTNRPGANKMGTVGKPMEGVEIKIADDGELLFKGWVWGKGYWNNEAATRELYKDGWLNTGDVATVDEDGYLKIIGRKKEIIITSGGKNVSPSWVENILKMSPFISQAVVFGEGKDYLTVLVTLIQEEIERFAQENNIRATDYADLVKRQEVIDMVNSEIEKKNQELSRAEQVKKFVILAEEFRQDRDEVTPTFKIKRRVIAERYGELVQIMYSK